MELCSATTMGCILSPMYPTEYFITAYQSNGDNGWVIDFSILYFFKHSGIGNATGVIPCSAKDADNWQINSLGK